MRRFLAAFPLALLAGCDLVRPLCDCPARSPIVPLAVGNAWAYVDSAFYGGDSVTVDSTHIEIPGVREVSLGGKTRRVFLWNVRDRATGEPGALSLYVQNRGDGHYTVGASRDTAEFLFETLHVKYPAARGERYATRFLDLREENGTWVPVIDTLEIEVVAPDTLCATPAGTFRCAHYRGWRGETVHADAYYAPGIGYLGSDLALELEVNGETRTVLFRKRLARYEVK